MVRLGADLRSRLEREDRDRSRSRSARRRQPEASDQEGAASRRRHQRNQPPREITIDWAGLKRRTRQLTRMPFSVSTTPSRPTAARSFFVTRDLAAAQRAGHLYDSGGRTPPDARTLARAAPRR